METTMPQRTRAFYSVGDLRRTIEKEQLDAVVVGSDQVWRSSYQSDGDWKSYLLDVPSVRRFSYAASLGVDELPGGNRQEAARRLLRNFDALSVREVAAKGLLEDELGLEAVEVTLDPTLLVDDDFYESLYDAAPNPQSAPYVFSYILDEGSQSLGFDQRVVDSLGAEHTVHHLGLYEAGEKATVGLWLRLFRDASFVVTDSYHGTLMAIRHHKRFIAIGNRSRGLSRFESLLSLLGLSDRLLVDDGPAVEDLANKPIDYVAVASRLDDLRRRSNRFLDEALLASSSTPAVNSKPLIRRSR
jgi:polysaccharide pyruvyl transferase WcaK-like protein